MDYKNKYEQALERARIWKDKSGMPKDKQGILDDIFPELKESEDDRIRKWIIGVLSTYEHDRDLRNAAIDWLEKQGEHANFRNKIQIGDKVTRNRDGVLVNLSQLNRVAKKDEKQGEQKPTDEEMKELLQTEYEKGRADAIAEMQKYWSEEDEEMLKMVIKLCEQCGNEYAYYWLNSLKERILPKQEWSEEDENRINRLIAYFEDKESFTAEDDVVYANWLNSLKDRVQPQSQWKPSDRDIKLLRELSDGKICPDNYRTRLYEIINNLKFL